MSEPKTPKPSSKPAKPNREADAQPLGEAGQEILDAYEFMRQEGLETLEVSDKNSKLKIRRQSDKEHAVPVSRKGFSSGGKASKPAAAPTPESSANTIVTPLMGIFYRSPSPSSEPFVQDGKTVEKNAIVCIVEAMKVMNEIRADRRCKIVRILVENGKQVSPQQPLFEVEYL